MMTTSQDSDAQEAPAVLQTIPDALNLLENGAVGYCSGGVCHIPAPKTQQ